eukprot:Rmarinus@m.28696
MIILRVLLALQILLAAYAVPTIWPQPVIYEYGDEVIAVDPAVFSISTASHSNILTEAIQRYRGLIFGSQPAKVSIAPEIARLERLEIHVAKDSEELRVGTDESYTFTMSDGLKTASIEADTVFGALRGLESFSQLINTDLVITHAPVKIIDYPRYPWRGLLVDTSRHFLSLDQLKRAIDGLAYAKMNTMHWHIVDAQSFPLEVTMYPELTQKGAYDANRAVYSHQDIHEIVEYGRYRGVRVYVEVDVPGHAHCWGYGYPELTVDCSDVTLWMDATPLDISKEFTYEVVEHVLTEAAALFGDEFVHVGGDEVIFDCWENNDDVRAWVEERGMSYAEAEGYFIQKALDYVRSTGDRRGMVWQEVFDHGTDLGKDTLIHVWLDAASLPRALKAGHQAILSQGWYLDVLVPAGYHYRFQDPWRDFYLNEPDQHLVDVSDDERANFLGGEACMWGEQVDDSNFDTRVWPRMGAVAERLWSPKTVDDIHTAEPRLADFRCLLWRRGIQAGPISWPDYCPTAFYP